MRFGLNGVELQEYWIEWGMSYFGIQLNGVDFHKGSFAWGSVSWRLSCTKVSLHRVQLKGLGWTGLSSWGFICTGFSCTESELYGDLVERRFSNVKVQLHLESDARGFSCNGTKISNSMIFLKHVTSLSWAISWVFTWPFTQFPTLPMA